MPEGSGPGRGTSDAGSTWPAKDAMTAARYDERFAALAATGHDVHGEASLVASLGVRSVLDAGCGTGRVAIELARWGLDVVGVDLDPGMLGRAREKAPGIPWLLGDLATVDLGRRFEAVVAAGNVMIFVRPGTEGLVLANLARHLEPGGALVAGFSLPPSGAAGSGALDLDRYDERADAAGLTLEARYATWEKEAFTEGSDYAVSVHRRR